MEVTGMCGQDPQSRGLSVTDYIKKQTGSFSEDTRRIGGYLVRLSILVQNVATM